MISVGHIVSSSFVVFALNVLYTIRYTWTRINGRTSIFRYFVKNFVKVILLKKTCGGSFKDFAKHGIFA